MNKPSRFQFKSVLTLFFKPRSTFQAVAGNSGSWLTPMLVLTLLTLISVFASGWQQSQAAQSGQIPTPPDYQYWTADQQAQYMQSYQSRQGPVFLYGIPALTNLAGAWFGWLVLGGLLHLLVTLMGGRGDTSTSMNIVAWASLPIGLRELVRALYLFFTQHAIAKTGLSGFVDTSAGGASLFVASLLALVDLYLLWQIVLLIIGVRSATSIPAVKTVACVLTTMLLIVLAQALIGYGWASLGSLSITRPFFF